MRFVSKCEVLKFGIVLSSFEVRDRSQIMARFRAEGDSRICDSPNTKFFFLWKIYEKVVFLCNLRTTPYIFYALKNNMDS